MSLNISNGYIVYTRGKDSIGYWKRVHDKAITDAATLPRFYQEDFETKYISAGERLLFLGQVERKKEIALIEKVTGVKMENISDIKHFISNFNDILMGKKQYEDALFRLKAALKKENQDKSAFAPTIASFFTSKLGTILNKNINAFITKNLEALQQGDYSKWEKRFDSIIDKSIDQAFKELLTETRDGKRKDMYGDSSVWTEFYDISQTIDGFNDDFKSMIRSKIDFERIKNIFKKSLVSLKKGEHRGVRKLIDSKQGLNLDKRSRSLGGSVQEYITQLAYSFGQALSASSSGGTTVLKSETLKADTVSLFQFEENITYDTKYLLDALQDTLLDTTSLQDATDRMEQYYNQYLSQLNDSFVIYGSTKSYSLSNSFKGFSAGGTRKLSEIPGLLDKIGLGNHEVVDKYVKIAYNTAAGAIFEGEREQVKEGLRAQLMGAIAELLFDDWYSFGDVRDGGAKSIHVLQLEGIQIPLSVFLIATGEAFKHTIENMNSFARIHINPFNKITYSNKNELGELAKKDGKEGKEIKNFIVEKWNEERKKAEKESTFSLTFLSNFKTIIKQWLE